MILRVRTPRSLSWVGLTALLLLAVVLLPLGVSGADRPAEKPRPATDEGAEALPEDPLSQARARDQLERDRLDALLLQFNTLYKQGRYAEAEKVAQEAVKMAPDDPRALAAVALSRAMQRPPASPPPPEEVQAARREQLERARDEVELLEAQLATKKAQLGAAKVAYEAAVQLAQSAKTEAAIAEAEREATVQQAQVRVREAELLEPELRLKQARRRLQALEQAGRSKPNLPTPGSPPSTDDDRLREVERKLDRLLREIESLRRDVPRKQSDRGEEPSDTIRINERNFDIPIRVDPDRAGQIRELLLFVSDDRGASWRQAASAAPTDDRISFTAPRDGEYWFSLCIVNKQGVREPQTPQGHPPANKILVDTKAQ